MRAALTHHARGNVLGKTHSLFPRITAVLHRSDTFTFRRQHLCTKPCSTAQHESIRVHSTALHDHFRQTGEHIVHTHHILNDVSQRSSFDVLRDEVEPLVFVEDADELQHIGMIQASHDLHLNTQSNNHTHTSADMHNRA